MTQIESVKTLPNPRFTLIVNGVRARVTRLGTDDRGRTHFELASTHPDFDDEPTRDVFPTDRGYVEDGEVYIERYPNGFNDPEYEHIGDVEASLLRVSDSVTAELTDPVVETDA